MSSINGYVKKTHTTGPRAIWLYQLFVSVLILINHELRKDDPPYEQTWNKHESTYKKRLTVRQAWLK